MTEVTRPIDTTSPWGLLIKERRWNAYRMIGGLALVLTLLVLAHAQNRSLDRSYRRELEYARQVSTLIAENKRLREHCRPDQTSFVYR